MVIPPRIIDLSDGTRKATFLRQSIMAQLDPGMNQASVGQASKTLVAGRHFVTWQCFDVLFVAESALSGALVTKGSLLGDRLCVNHRPL